MAIWGGAVALLAIGVLIGWTIGPPGGLGGSPSPTQNSPVAQRSPSPRVTAPTPVPRDPLLWPEGLFAGDRRDVRVDGIGFSFNVPAYGWEQYGSLYVSKSTVGPQNAEAMIFWARFPEGKFAQACPYVANSNVSTAAELASVLATDLDGPDLVSGPSEVTVGGLPAQKVVLFARDFGSDACGPGFFYTWDGEDQRSGAMWGGGVLGDTVTVWVVDVYGTLFVIGGQTHLNASAGLVQEVQQIVDSISFAEVGLSGDYLTGRHAVNVDGIRLSFRVPGRGWEPNPGLLPPYRVSINRSSGGSQAAEAMIYWTRLPGGAYADPCDYLAGLPADASAGDFATAIASAPGTSVEGVDSDVTVGGYPATQVAVVVQKDLGCGPGYFHTWEAVMGGAFWLNAEVGDTIRAWIVDIDGTPFLIAGETRFVPGPDDQIQQIIDSIQFK